ncbi:GPO family capsid scaffolding protein [Comamonas koreensis]|uniref:GPO family capsid scaffolding protein n=1 Tax=Comamonas koreensis TaxID=160825 RepID=UPI0015FA641A|nr:GPO family capsid scaffolding protein [Comamonas koreensis]
MPSKFFRVATEGATTDGRTIQRSWIEQAAANYNTGKYQARVWLEHIRGVMADSAFAALGDVTALKAVANAEGKMELFAQVEALPALVAMNKAKQKIFTSIEIDPDFAKSGQAYMVGLAVTDSPASLGTEVLAFSAEHPEANPFAKRKTNPSTLFTAALETDLGLEGDAEGIASAMLQKFNDVIDSIKGLAATKPAAGDTAFATKVMEAMGVTGTALQNMAKENAELLGKFTAQGTELETLKKDFAALKAKLEGTENHTGQRPAATGKDASELADC